MGTLFRVITLFPNRVRLRVAVVLLIPVSYCSCCFAALASISSHGDALSTNRHFSDSNVIPAVALVLGAIFLIINRFAYYDLRRHLLVFMKPATSSNCDEEKGENSGDGEESVVMAVVRSMRANSSSKVSRSSFRIHPQMALRDPRNGQLITVPRLADTASYDASTVFTIVDME